MTRYGIGLEGHLQNSIAVVRLTDAEPVRLLVRDLGGVRVWPERLAPHGIAARFHDNSATLADDEDDLRNKVHYAVVQNHLGELIASIARGLEIDENALWRPVASIGRAAYHDLAHDPSIASQIAADEAALFRPTMALKAMTTMRLLGDVTRYTFSEVPNPLAAAERSI
jgi:siderophore synthetase component